MDGKGKKRPVGLRKRTKNVAIDSEHGANKGGSSYLHTKRHHSKKEGYFYTYNTTHAKSIMCVLAVLHVYKIYSLLCRLKINQVTENRNMYLFLAQWFVRSRTVLISPQIQKYAIVTYYFILANRYPGTMFDSPVMTNRFFVSIGTLILTLIRMAVKKDIAVQLGVIYDSTGDHRKEGGLRP